jgi:hypothetical protein
MSRGFPLLPHPSPEEGVFARRDRHEQPETSSQADPRPEAPQRAGDPSVGRYAGRAGQGQAERAGRNRYGVADERAVHGRRSEPPWPRVMRRGSSGGGRSIDRGTRGPGVDRRDHHLRRGGRAGSIKRLHGGFGRFCERLNREREGGGGLWSSAGGAGVGVGFGVRMPGSARGSRRCSAASAPGVRRGVRVA